MIAIEAHITGTIWKILVKEGDAVEEGQEVAILESMKMEMPLEVEDAGTIAKVCCEEGQSVESGRSSSSSTGRRRAVSGGCARARTSPRRRPT